MRRLYSTFVTGLQEPVKDLLESMNQNAYTVECLMDGAVTYIQKDDGAPFLPCFHNTFEVLAREKTKDARLDIFMRKLLAEKDAAWHHRLAFPEGGRLNHPGGGVRSIANPPAFRLVTSVENTLVSADRALKSRLERLIETRAGLKADRGGMGHEYWLLYRSEGYMFFLKRLTRHAAAEKTLAKGELRPELAYLLNTLSHPGPDDIFLDPFCGHGAIPAARARYFPGRKIIASDADEAMINAARHNLDAIIRQPVLFSPSAAVITRHSAVQNLLSFLPPHSVTQIVTDPPWGLYPARGGMGGPPAQAVGPDPGLAGLRLLYAQFLYIALRLLARGGTMVILTARKDLLRELLSCAFSNGFRLTASYDILVNGKKAGVFAAERR